MTMLLFDRGLNPPAKAGIFSLATWVKVALYVLEWSGLTWRQSRAGEALKLVLLSALLKGP
jgi:hypothetical protein